MAAAKIRVSDIAKKMGKSEKDVIFQLQSLGAEVTDPTQMLEPEVIRMLLFGFALVLMMLFRPAGILPSALRKRELESVTRQKYE